MKRVRRCALVTAGVPAFACVALLTGAAPAHMMPPQEATLNVLGDSVFEAVSVPVSALHGVDDDGDGRLSVAEIEAHEAELQGQIGSRFRISEVLEGESGDAVRPGRRALASCVQSMTSALCPPRRAEARRGRARRMCSCS